MDVSTYDYGVYDVVLKLEKDSQTGCSQQVVKSKNKEINIPIFLQNLLHHFPFLNKILNQIITIN
jgi:hypothetical protein